MKVQFFSLEKRRNIHDYIPLATLMGESQIHQTTNRKRRPRLDNKTNQITSHPKIKKKKKKNRRKRREK